MNIGEVVLRSGNRFDETASALQKELRRGREYEALWFAEDLADSGYDGYSWKRIVVTAVEDVGLASLETVKLVCDLQALWERLRRKDSTTGIRLPDWNIMALAIIAVCRAPKNRTADDLAWLIELDKKAGKRVPIPSYAIDGHTEKGKSKIREIARKQRREFITLWNEEFYHEVGRSNNPVEVNVGVNGVNWMEHIIKRVGCDYPTYVSPIVGDKVERRCAWAPEIYVLNRETKQLSVSSQEMPGKSWFVDLLAGTCTCGGSFKENVCFHLVHAQKRMANMEMKKADLADKRKATKNVPEAHPESVDSTPSQVSEPATVQETGVEVA